MPWWHLFFPLYNWFLLHGSHTPIIYFFYNFRIANSIPSCFYPPSYVSFSIIVAYQQFHESYYFFTHFEFPTFEAGTQVIGGE